MTRSAFRLRDLSGSARLAVAAFVVLVFGMLAAAQATVWLTVGEGRLPGRMQIRGKYHGRPDRTALHDVLDLSRPASDPRAMYVYLDPLWNPEDLTRVEARRAKILAWVDAGTPEDTWPEVRTLLHDQATCLQCHGFGTEKFADVPLETLEEVRRVTVPGRGIPLRTLLVSAHNHTFAFAVLALLLGLGTAATGLRRGGKAGLILLAFGGAALDVGCWFLTRAYGGPWEVGILVGGASFGLAVGGMALAVLDEVVLGGRVVAGVLGGHLAVGSPRASREISS